MATGDILTQAEHARVAAAIRAAEAGTSGEIVCVLARTSDSYFYPAAFVLTLGMLVASGLAALAVDRLWLVVPLWQFVLVQAVALAALLCLLLAFPGLRIGFVPRGLRYRRAHRNAVTQFVATNIHRTANRTGVLIFVSLAEHYAEIVADAGIDARVPQERWDSIVAGLMESAAKGDLAGGFERSVTEAGELLAREFPVGRRDANELEDRLVEI